MSFGQAQTVRRCAAKPLADAANGALQHRKIHFLIAARAGSAGASATFNQASGRRTAPRPATA